jgi:hypothetical protein
MNRPVPCPCGECRAHRSPEELRYILKLEAVAAEHLKTRRRVAELELALRRLVDACDAASSVVCGGGR